MFSAGSLNAQVGKNLNGVTSHAETGSHCDQCHAAPWSSETMTDRCLACHLDVKTQLADQQSMHGVMIKTADIPCQACHPDHRGPTAALTDMNPGSFPHQNLGFSLQAHKQRSDSQAFTCSDCHIGDITKFDQAACIDCHKKIDVAFMPAHIQDYPGDCLNCHDGVESVSKNFDHGRMTFKLDGKHIGLACVKCHLDAHSPADLKATPLECSSCHQKDDEHAGKFGQNCAACHSAAGWKPASFDHNLSGFKLDGKHVDVTCNACHKNNVFKGTPATCAACHADPTYHAGMFPGQACSDCHSTASWRPAKYNGTHSFPMDHGEKNNTCADCHQPTLTQWTCSTCHAQNEISRKHQEEGISDFSDCLRCHASGRKEEGHGGGEGGDD